ncbi:MAG TPA: MFS transporter [Woeseiaceae bacterium]|nr:MFS transporter [Woeseiaceae bacterium]
MKAGEVDAGDIVDGAGMGRFQYTVVALCFALIMVDGFDTQSIAFVAPALRDAWSIPPQTFGILFSAGLLGTMIGAMALGGLGDRIGRRPVILGATLVFASMSLLCATAPGVETLLTYRFVGGLGLGGLLPNAIALVAEFSPKRVRSTVVVSSFIGFPLGAVIGGMASARIIPAFGWEAVFLAGGIIPLALLVIAWLALPESLRFMVRHRRDDPRIGSILARIRPDLGRGGLVAIREAEHAAAPSVQALFAGGRAAWTLWLWLLSFCSLLLTYFLVHWIPLVLVDAGIDPARAIVGVALLNLGGIVGSIVISRLSDTRGAYLPMGIALALAIVLIAAIGSSVGAGAPVVLSVIFLAGATFVGMQLNLSALAANHYPVEIRSAGTGWSIAAGRVGSIVGPLVGGLLIGFEVGIDRLFLIAAVPAAIALACIVAMARAKRQAGVREHGRSAAAPGTATPG